jgi:HAD superfamily hydrolase (TIGR01509 family)
MAIDDQTEKLIQLLNNSKGVLFDFDGVLADSEPYHYLAYNEVFERYGHTIDRDEYWIEFTGKGKGIQGEVERHNLKLDVSPEDMRQQKFDVYSRYCEEGDIKLFPGVKELVEKLASSHKIIIASNSWEHDIRAILKNADANHLFEKIIGKTPGKLREKPHPDIFIKAAEEIGLQPSQCIVLEDALKGLKAAKEAGAPCIIILNPLNQNCDFDEADCILPSIEAFSRGLTMRKAK